MRNEYSVDLDLEYAVRMISTGCVTPEQGAQMCGIPLATLQARVHQSASASASAADAKALAAIIEASDSATSTRAGHAKSAAGGLARNRETGFAARERAAAGAPNVAALVPSTAVYSRTAKGVLAITAQAKKFPSTLKNVFFAVDNKATVGELLVTVNMNPAYTHHALRALENEGYIEVFRHEAAEEEYSAAHAAEDTDLDFTTPEAFARAASPAPRRMVSSLREIRARAGAPVETPHAPVNTKLTGPAPRGGAAAVREASPEARDAVQPILRPVSIGADAKPIAPAHEPARARVEHAEPQAQMQMQMKAALEAERRAREAPQANAEADRRARDEALQLLEEAVQALRDMKSSTAEEQRQRAHADAEALAERQALQARLEQTEAALVQAEKFTHQAQLQIGNERRAREDAESKAQAERRARGESVQAVEQARQQAQQAEAGRRAAEVRLDEMQTALKGVEQAGAEHGKRLEHMQQEIATERRAREDAQAALNAERRAHEATSKASSDFKEAMAAQRAQHEQQARTLAEAHALRNALEIELTGAKTERERAIEAAYRHAERHAQIELDVETERRAREEAEGRARESAQALLEVRTAVGRWKNA